MPEHSHDATPPVRAAVTVQAFLAESVAVADGRMFVQGTGWAHLSVPALPAHPGRLGIGLMLSVPRSRTDERIPLALRIEDPEGEPLGLSQLDSDALVAAELEGALTAEPAPADSPLDFQLVPVAFNLDALRVERAGEHAVIVEVDGQLAARVPFAVMVDP